MAYKIWVHNCINQENLKVEYRERICPECGQQGIFDGWGHSVIERMASYKRRYNLRPLGPHRKLADELFDGRMIKCDQCNGYGLVDSPDDEDHGEICPKCNYGKYVFNGSPEEFDSIRQKVIAAFPSADPAGPLPPKNKSLKTAPIKKEFEGGGFYKPVDEGLQAYKEFAMGLYKAINPNSNEDSTIMSDEKWEESYKRAMWRSKDKK